ncbi:MAG TPA: EAL domain-containing protein [Gammaproteobacteria bacterium]|nr:EAL domain-containing protein [Gammaproteobacteria bacterium]
MTLIDPASVAMSAERDQPEGKLARQAAYFRTLFENLPDAVAVLDMNGRVLNANRGFEMLFGYSLVELRGRNIDSRVTPAHLLEEAKALSKRALGGETLQTETMRRCKNGDFLPVRVHAFPIVVRKRQAGAYVIYTDISEARRANQRALWQATHDGLTGLINRAEFERRLAALLPCLTDGVEHSLLYIDLDEFKVVNDICGHSAGDDLLRQLAEEISADIGADDVLARLGGDEFGVLLRNCAVSRAERLARKLIRAVAGFRFVCDGRGFTVGASIGVVGIDSSCRRLPDLFAAADAACYSAKEKGGNRVRVYQRDDADIARRSEQMGWVSRLAEALEGDRFLLYHQAISSLHDDDGMRWNEILLRFRAENGDVVTPDHFIPAAERYHLMPALDRWVVRKVFGGLRRELNARGAGIRQVLAINISGETVGEPSFRRFVREQLERFQVPPTMICFEITETAAIENLDQATAFIDEMRALGCSISLDDFGSGLSSFPYLKTLHVDYLKIDGAFVRDMADDPIDCAMVETINRVGKIMGVKTVAEYVEMGDVLGKLRELGVDFAQGYDIHVPEPWRWAPGLT